MLVYSVKLIYLFTDNQANNKHEKGTQLRMLDLYSGCGGMSTGLCLGANLANVNLVTVSLILFQVFVYL